MNYIHDLQVLILDFFGLTLCAAHGLRDLGQYGAQNFHNSCEIRARPCAYIMAHGHKTYIRRSQLNKSQSPYLYQHHLLMWNL